MSLDFDEGDELRALRSAVADLGSRYGQAYFLEQARSGGTTQALWADAGKAFAAVYYGYDLPELKYAALVEHARALAAEGKPAEAAKLLEKVTKDAPADSPWAKSAKELAAKVK